jgi:hypothetical protein
VVEGLYRLVQVVLPVDDRRDLPVLEQLAQTLRPSCFSFGMKKTTFCLLRTEAASTLTT